MSDESEHHKLFVNTLCEMQAEVMDARQMCGEMKVEGLVSGRHRPRCAILRTPVAVRWLGIMTSRWSDLCSRRSQPSGIGPTTSVGELNHIGEPKDPSVVHPPALDST